MTAARDITIVGAGVVGLVTALRLAQAGETVTLVDEGRDSSASSVAAGMLAPASETLLEHGDVATFRRLLSARDLWPALAAATPGLVIDRSGAEVELPDDRSLAEIIQALEASGIAFDASPGPPATVFLPQDWRIDPEPALSSLREAVEASGVRIRSGRVTATPGAFMIEGAPLAGTVVIAAGFGAQALSAAAPELAGLQPIKGQIACFPVVCVSGRTRRTQHLYLAPQPTGARAGATMEPGCTDETVDPSVIAGLARRAAKQDPSLKGAAFTGAAGVRASTPDGWPMVGPSATSGVLLAVGARRNGWLLAPMMADLVVAHVQGRAAGELAAAFHPGRFSR